jgi:predicted amidohydrolase YtcJ
MPDLNLNKSFLTEGAILLAIVVPILLAATACSSPQTRRTADLIVSNAKIWTVDPAHPKAEAVAAIGDRIAAVGTVAEIDVLRGPKTIVIDAEGKSVLPGFNDAHVHFIDGGCQLDNVELKNAASAQEFARRIAERARSIQPGDWILGGGWDEQAWDKPLLPAKGLLDPDTASVPVFVNRYDGHMSLANSVALRLAGIAAKTPDPPGGEIVRDAHGNPTGILKDGAMGLVSKIIPPLTAERRMRAAQRALAYAASLGVTSVQDMGPDYADIALYMALAEKGELTARVYAAPPEMKWMDQARIGIRRGFGTSYLRLGAIKGFADGSLGSTTAYFFEPYADAPQTRGLLSDEMQPVSGMQDRLLKADEAGLQLCIHAIGDQAVSITLDMFQAIEAAHGSRDYRFRIEHAQHIAPKDFDRFTRMKVVASVQPYHAIDDGRWAEKRIGTQRAKTTYPFRSFLDRKVPLALGTDWPVAPLNPVLSIYAATTRATLDGKHPQGWVPEQKITVAEAIEAYTVGSAYAEFQERDKGSLEAGKLADMVILSEDLFSIDLAAIKEAKVVATIVGGRVAFSRLSVQ